MIEIIKKNNFDPYLRFYGLLDNAIQSDQKAIDAISVSSLDKVKNEVNSRYVNLKYIDNEDWIFFSNYDGPKANDFKQHDQISVLFYWQKINIQIRIKASIRITSSKFSDRHFKIRSKEKNALAISSKQSRYIQSFDEVKLNYDNIYNSDIDLSIRPNNWGGFSFEPYYFEFWEGNNSRLNKRQVFSKEGALWQSFFIQP